MVLVFKSGLEKVQPTSHIDGHGALRLEGNADVGQKLPRQLAHHARREGTAPWQTASPVVASVWV